MEPEARLNIYSQIANLYEKIGKYELSIEAYFKALNYAPDDYTRAKLDVNIAPLMINVKDYVKAEAFIDRSIPLFRQQGNLLWIAIATGTKSNIYKAQKNIEKALQVNKEAYDIVNSIAVNPLQLTAKDRDAIDIKNMLLNNIADGFLLMNQPDSAGFYLKKIGPQFHLLPSYAQSGILVTMGEVCSQKRQDRLASVYIERGLDIAVKAGYKEIIIKAHQELSRLYAQQGKHRQAWLHGSAYINMKDDLYTSNDIHEISRLEARYQIAKKDSELAAKKLEISEQQKEIQSRNLISGILVLGLTSAISIIFLSRRSLRNGQRLYAEKELHEEKRRKILLIEAGIKGEERERSRIAGELHDAVVSEVLAMKLNLQSLMEDYPALKYTSDYKNILIQSELIADKLRQTAHNLMPVNIKEQGLFDTIGAFLQRINNRNIRFRYQHYGSLPELKGETEKIILLLVLELIQNVIKHSRATEALIQLNYFDRLLSITVEDNGVGLSEQQLDSKGIGLLNLKENIAMLNAQLDIQSSEFTGTNILIEIPMEEHIVCLQEQIYHH